METWKSLDEFYDVSDFGNVRSKDRIVKSTWGGEYVKKGRILKLTDNNNGYFQVCLSYNGKYKYERIHRLVAILFVENPLKLPKVNHIDGDKHNNRATNLEWCTQEQNVAHAISHGLQCIGVNRPNSRLVEKDVIDIKAMIKEGFTNKEIAELFNVHKATINCIRIGRNWSHIKLPE